MKSMRGLIGCFFILRQGMPLCYLCPPLHHPCTDRPWPSCLSLSLSSRPSSVWYNAWFRQDLDPSLEMDACASYVSLLQSRRADEEASRNSRSQRRANTVAANNDLYKRRAGAIRRRAMEEKLHMTSQKEHELFEELSALSKWRHVMYENISHREAQHADAQRLHEKLVKDHLSNVRHHEDAKFKEALRDDTERFDSVLKATVEAKKKNVEQCCRGVVSDILTAVGQHIAFIHHHDLGAERGGVPKLVSDAMARKAAFPTDPDAVKQSIIARHVDGTVYQDPAHQDPSSDARALHGKLFVSLVHKILNLQYPKPPPFKPKNPTPFPIVAVVGPKFSGKSTIAAAVAESLGMVCLSDTSLIQSAIAEFEKELTPDDWNSETSAELLDLGRECQETLLSGKPVGVDLLSRLILYRLRCMPEDSNGVLLDGSPANVEGFEQLEKVLSGYDKTRMAAIPDELLAPLIEDLNIDDPIFNVEKVDTSVVDPALAGAAKKDAKPKPKGKKDEHEDPLPPIDLPSIEPVPPMTEDEEEAIAACERDADVSSLHSVIHLDCPAEEIFRRFAGLRVDTETGRVYHLAADPPPADRLPFLVARDRAEASTAKIHKMVEEHMEEWNECLEWLHRYEGIVHNINATQGRAELTTTITDLTNLAADNAGLFYQRYCLAQEVRQRQEELEQLYQERVANREAARKQLAAIYLERGADLPPELQDPPKSAEVALLVLPSDLPPLFLEQLHSFTKFYTASVNESHQELQSLMTTVYEYGNTCASFVAAYWQQSDGKQAALDAFIGDFNQMQPALRRDIQGKEELHLRAEQLTEQLFSVVERRREECSQLIEALHHRATLTDAWSDSVRSVGIALVQSELERFFIVRNLSLLYYSALRNDPCSVEEELLELVPQLKQVAQESVVDPKASKDKKAPPPKKGAKGADDGSEKAQEDIFTPAVEKALHIIKSAVERLTAAQPNTAVGKGAKDKKNVAESVLGDGPTSQGLTAPIMNDELEATNARIQIIVNFVKETIALGLRRVESVKSKLVNNLRKKQIVQSSAVNSAIFEIRCAIEEERPVLFHLHLGCDSFAVDPAKPLATMADAVCLSGVPFAGLAAPTVHSVMVLTSLTRNRVLELIRYFRILAPNYDLHKQDFVLLVRPSDYADAIPKAAAHLDTPLPVAELFDRFDVNGCGAIDWRDFVVHLLFWCEPVSTESALFESTDGATSLGIEGPSLMQLFDMRADIGNEPLVHEDFLDTPLFFDGDMAEDRLTAYLDILWEVFRQPASDGQSEVLYPNVLMTFLAPDPQPLRGVQKAFVVAAAPGDETCAARLEALDTVFHLNATSPRHMLMYDPHDVDVLRGLFGEGQETLIFNDACKSHVGRVLFNGTRIFHRKTFL